MNKTKKGLLIAGSIISIIEAVILIGVGILIAIVTGVLDAKVVEEILVEEGFSHTVSEVDEIVGLGKVLGITIAIISIVQAVALMVVAIILLNRTKKNVYNKGLNIALLVLSVMIGDLLIMSFMIAGLAIKDKTPTLENIKELGEKYEITDESIQKDVEEIEQDK